MFYHYSPVKILNGVGALMAMRKEVKAGLRVLVLHGRSFDHHRFIDRDVIRDTLNECDIEFSVIPDGDPSVAGLERFVDANSVRPQFILAIGGGRVIDFAKAYALSHSVDISSKITSMEWNEHSRSIPLGIIVTRPGSGSESNNAFIISDRQGFKRSLFSLQSYPRFCVHDPMAFDGLSKEDFILGLFDAFMHVIDQYCADRERALVVDELSSCFSLILGELAKNAKQMSVCDFQQLAWVSCLISSSILSRGVYAPWKFHQVAHVIDGRVGLGHGLSLIAVAQKVYDIGVVDRSRCDLLIKKFGLGFGKHFGSIGELISEIAPGALSMAIGKINSGQFSITEIKEACPDFSLQNLSDVFGGSWS